MRLQLGTDPRLVNSPATRALVVLNVAIWALGLIGDLLGIPAIRTNALRLGFGLFPSLVLPEGMFWTPFTYMFLHGNLTHLVLNMLGLVLLGPDLERAFGMRNYLLLYLGAGLAGGWGYLFISHFLFGQTAPCVGASGAIMGLLGATVALYPRRVYVLLPLMIPMRATVLAVLLVTTHLFFILTPYGGNVAYDVHLMGGLLGWAVATAVAAWHRRAWAAVIPVRELPYALVELEGLADRFAQTGGQLSDGERERFELLLRALRYEDLRGSA